MAKKKAEHDTDQKLDTIIELLRRVLAVQLYKNGVSQADIGKHLHVAKAAVGNMVKGIRKEK